MSIRQIIREVASAHGLTGDDIIQPGRKMKVVLARQEVMWRARQMQNRDGSPRFSFPRIGRSLLRDHSTVIHGVRAHEARLAEHTVKSPNFCTTNSGCGARGGAKHNTVSA